MNIHFEQNNLGHFLFNFEHDYKVYKARKKLGLPTCRQKDLPNHPWLNKHVINKDTKTVYLVEKVYQEYHGGWYIKMLIQHNGSHCIKFVDNINCFIPYIVQNIEQDKESFSLYETD